MDSVKVLKRHARNDQGQMSKDRKGVVSNERGFACKSKRLARRIPVRATHLTANASGTRTRTVHALQQGLSSSTIDA